MDSPLVFLARTSTPAEWKVVAAAVQTLVEEATFVATPEGLIFKAMDPSHIALVDLSWPSSAFARFECDKEVKFSLRVADFVKLIRRADAKDSVEISMAEDDVLVLSMENGYKREFRLHLIESTYSPTPLPKISFKSKVTLSSSGLERILSDIATVSDHVSVGTVKEEVHFAGKSDTGTAGITLTKGGTEEIEISSEEESRATYSLEYLTNMVKAAGGASEKTVLEYSSKMPLRLEFRLGESGGTIHFYLAPRIEEK